MVSAIEPFGNEPDIIVVGNKTWKLMATEPSISDTFKNIRYGLDFNTNRHRTFVRAIANERNVSIVEPRQNGWKTTGAEKGE